MRIPDPSDVATHHEEQERERILNAHKSRPVESPLIIDGSRCCKDCEEPIPKQRIATVPTCVRCVDCERILEIRNKGKA